MSTALMLFNAATFKNSAHSIVIFTFLCNCFLRRFLRLFVCLFFVVLFVCLFFLFFFFFGGGNFFLFFFGTRSNRIRLISNRSKNG